MKRQRYKLHCNYKGQRKKRQNKHYEEREKIIRGKEIEKLVYDYDVMTKL